MSSRRKAINVETAIRYALDYKCPDCDADLSPVIVVGNLVHFQAHHDTACPSLGGASR